MPENTKKNGYLKPQARGSQAIVPFSIPIQRKFKFCALLVSTLELFHAPQAFELAVLKRDVAIHHGTPSAFGNVGI